MLALELELDVDTLVWWHPERFLPVSVFLVYLRRAGDDD